MALLERKRPETEKRIDDLNDKIMGVNDKIEGIVSEVNTQMSSFLTQIQEMLEAKQAPAVIRQTLEPMEADQGPDHVAQFTQDINPTEPPQIVIPQSGDIHDPIIKRKLDMLAFMKEKIRIYILEDSSENPMIRFPVSVNGEKFVFERNKEYNVPRYVVEGLLRARPIHYTNEEYTDTDGIQKVRWPSRRGLRFPFSMIHPTPKDNEWMTKVSRER